MLSLFLNNIVEYEKGFSATNIFVRESIERYPTYTFTPKDIFILNGKVFANIYKVSVDKKDKKKWVTSKDFKTHALSKNNIIHCRLMPPVGQEYMSVMQILSKVKQNNLVINDPDGIITSAEKILPDSLNKFLPATLISNDIQPILDFHKKHKLIVLKPLYEYGGRNVLKLGNEKNIKKIISEYLTNINGKVVVQKFIKEIKIGDKRILFLDGKVVGQFLKKPKLGDFRANMINGATIEKCKLTIAEKEMCAVISMFLKEKNIYVAGIDCIGGKLTEINVTCPGGFSIHNDIYNSRLEKTYWDGLEKKLKKLNLS